MNKEIRRANRKPEEEALIKSAPASEICGKQEIERIVSFREGNPFNILGPHIIAEEETFVIYAFLPRAVHAWVMPLEGDTTQTMSAKQPMERLDGAGFFEARFPHHTKPFHYKVGFEDASGFTDEHEDPYAFSTEITDYDLHLMGEGQHFKSYEKFGARLSEFHGVKGVHFAVWAPHAECISVVGNFNHWTTGEHPMMRIGDSNVWGLFIPGLCEGEVYKFAIRSKVNGEILLKTDPYAFQAELRPHTASVVASLNHFQWKDGDWLAARAKQDPLSAPFSVYEVHLGSWRRDAQKNWSFLNYRELARQLVDYVKRQGYTHIELLPVMEHPLDQSWGYQVISFYAPTSRFGKPEDFMYFVDYCHQHGIGVLLDWVPSHFPRDGHGLNDFDGRQIYAYENWKKGEHKEWGTLVFDYGRNEVKNFLISNALFWLEKYHIDGLRVDAVASMIYLDYSRNDGEWEPNMFGGREHLEAVDFLKKFNEIVHREYPGVVTIAEESTAWAGVSRPTYTGGLGFTMKWNMGWMHDTLEYFCKDPVHRQHHQDMLTFSLLYAFTENFVLPISHDEVVHGKRALVEKMPGDEWQKFANTRLFLTYMFAHPGKKILFMTNDIGQRDEWNCERSLDWHLLRYASHETLNYFMRDLNKLYRNEQALYEVDFDPQGFEWIDFQDAASSVLSFLRWSARHEQLLICAFNMTPVPRYGYRIGAPKAGFYRELLNSDAAIYGGGNIGNAGGVHTEVVPWHHRPASLVLNLPPLGGVIFRYEG